MQLHFSGIVEAMEMDTKSFFLSFFMFCLCFSQFSIAIRKYPRQLIYQDKKLALAHDFHGSLWRILSGNSEEWMTETNKVMLCVSVVVGGRHNCKREQGPRRSLHSPSKTICQRSLDLLRGCYALKVPHLLLVFNMSYVACLASKL